MADTNNSKAFEFLQQVEKRSLDNIGTSTREEELSRFWTGVGFKMAGNDYLVNLKEVGEIMPIPPYTKVPGVKPWVKGLANIRGTLIPILDLHGFLGRRASPSLRRQRILVVNHETIQCGVIVDEILGLNHFEDEEWIQEVPVLDEIMEPFLAGGFAKEDKTWNVFSLFSLVETPAFRQVAL